ncbi:hypothetical protein MPLA_970007 [Mesorhizobium sp. ORS 3359]|nr:hypothetical protein MPLA_970007 [Mesorhizobium sp. ORS 3359]
MTLFQLSISPFHENGEMLNRFVFSAIPDENCFTPFLELH